MVREVKGIEKMSVLDACRGARERGGRRLEVEVDSKRRSPSHYVSHPVLETVAQPCLAIRPCPDPGRQSALLAGVEEIPSKLVECLRDTFALHREGDTNMTQESG